MTGETAPGIDGDPAPGLHVVDKVSVTGPELENAGARRNQSREVVAAERLPEQVPTRIEREPRLKIGFGAHRDGQPTQSPRIICSPTRRARPLLTLPPLLAPTRGWNVIGHSTSFSPCVSATSRKWSLNSRLTAGFRRGINLRRLSRRSSLYVVPTSVKVPRPRCFSSRSFPTKKFP